MPSEARIALLSDLLQDLAKVSGGYEKTRIVPNLEVIDDAPADLSADYVIIKNEEGYYAPAVKTAGLTVTTGDYVNVIYIEGTEPIVFQQGSSGTPPTYGGVWPDEDVVKIDGSTTEYATLSAAITAASDGDVIRMGAGAFTESAAISTSKNLIIIGSGKEATSLTFNDSGQTNSAIFIITASTYFVLENMTLDYAHTNYNTDFGGISAVIRSSTPGVILRNVYVGGSSTHAADIIAGVYLYDSVATARLIDTDVILVGGSGNTVYCLYNGHTNNSISTSRGLFSATGGGVNTITEGLGSSASLGVGSIYLAPTTGMFSMPSDTGRWFGPSGELRLPYDVAPTDGQLLTWDGGNGRENWEDPTGGNVWPYADEANIDGVVYADIDDFFDNLANGVQGIIGEGTYATDYDGGHGTIPTGADVLGSGINVTVLSTATDSEVMEVAGSSQVENLTCSSTVNNGFALVFNTGASSITSKVFAIINGTGSVYAFYAYAATVRLVNCMGFASGGSNNYAAYATNAATVTVDGGWYSGQVYATGAGTTISLEGLPVITGAVTAASGAVIRGSYIDGSGNVQHLNNVTVTAGTFGLATGTTVNDIDITAANNDNALITSGGVYDHTSVANGVHGLASNEYVLGSDVTGHKVEAGNVTDTTNSGLSIAYTTPNKAVTFPLAFGATPEVVVGIISSSQGTAGAVSLSTTGFNIRIHSTANSTSYDASWIAKGS